MKIKSFKMKVTPEQSKIVQEILFSNGYTWQSGDTSIKLLEDNRISFNHVLTICGYNYYSMKIDEIDFDEFFKLYGLKTKRRKKLEELSNNNLEL